MRFFIEKTASNHAGLGQTLYFRTLAEVELCVQRLH